MTSVKHHIHIRKRIYQNLEKYPHPNKWKRFVDRFIYVTAIFGPLVSIPQILKIWAEKDASGISFITWLGFLFGAIFWLFYGIMHKEKPIILSSLLWIIVEIFILIGILIYG